MDQGLELRRSSGAASPERRAPAPEGRPGLTNVQALRGVAAFCVVLHHGFVYVEAIYGVRGFSTGGDYLLGVLGVSLFFAISGFLMARLVRDTDPWTFLTHRVARIFPPFLAIVGLGWALFAALGIPLGIQGLALTLAPVGPRTYPLNVEWTLVYETSFYVLLFLLALAGQARRLDAIALAWLAALALSWILLPAADRGLVLPPPHLLLVTAPVVPFAAGLLLPRAVAAGLFRPGLVLLALPPVAAAPWVEADSARWLVGLASVLVVGCAVQARQLAGASLPGRALMRLGDASYVLYLAHPLVLVLVLSHLPRGLPAWLPWTAGIVAALALALAAGPLDPMGYRRLRRGLDAAPARRRRALVLGYLLVFFGAVAAGGAELAVEGRDRSRAERALAALPADAFRSRRAAEAAIAAAGRRLPATLRAEADALGAALGQTLILGAWAADPVRPDGPVHLAAACGGTRVALDRARRRRPDVAARPGLEGTRGKRIGFRLTLPAAPCREAGEVVAILIDAEGRLGLLPGVERLEAGGLRP